MCHFRLLSGLVLLVAVAVGRADDKPAPPSLKDDLAKLRGAWKMADPSRDSHLYLEFGKAANLDLIHAVVGADGWVTARYAFAAFELTDRGPKRAIIPKKKGGRTGDLIYRFQGEALVIEEGECAIRDVNAQRDYKVSLKGEWKRVSPELEKLRASWRPAKPIRGTEIHLEFRNDILEVACRFSNELGMGPVEQRWILVELKGDGNKRGIVAANQRTGLSRITYRVDGDILVIDEGEYTVEGRTISLKGEWNGDRRNRLP
jgi:hypothetical protein